MVEAESPNNKICFVISPIGDDGSVERKKADDVFIGIIKPAAEACGYKPLRADHLEKSDLITVDLIRHLISSPLVIAELTGHNPNVFYELAVRHAVRKPVIQLIREGEKIPFDVKDMRTVFYKENDIRDARRCENEIIGLIRKIETNPNEVNNPISIAVDIEIMQNTTLAMHEQVLSTLRELMSIVDDNVPITEMDVLENFASLELFNSEDITNHLQHMLYNLLSNGIKTKKLLKGLLSSKKTFDTLEQLYREELLREVTPVLDPSAVASWGAYLYINNLSPDAVNDVRNRLRLSPESLAKRNQQ